MVVIDCGCCHGHWRSHGRCGHGGHRLCRRSSENIHESRRSHGHRGSCHGHHGCCHGCRGCCHGHRGCCHGHRGCCHGHRGGCHAHHGCCHGHCGGCHGCLRHDSGRSLGRQWWTNFSDLDDLRWCSLTHRR